ncbi:efflux RND transporter periplasmic adaptor subunit [Myxosarcina sp. GI1]|uniref:efflux RND transporter periplasmic adaptor subunit n=1 Tax=Myxosarcina sp. GI1 TaxID=1541065 RepID=UPI0009DEC61F|nr:efflux RND transporter periplasmic adaptor subunit [Myxosarcina sp. GI1]
MTFKLSSLFMPDTCISRISTSVVTTAILSISLSGCGGKVESQEPQVVAVKLKTIELDTLVDSSEYVGTLQATERVNLAPRIEGRILEIFVRQGDRVSRGDPIVKLEPTQEQENVNAAIQSVNVEQATLGQTRAELKTSEANRAAAAAEVEGIRADLQDTEAEVELAKTNIKRTKMLVKGGALPQQDLDEDNRDLKSSFAQRNSRKQTLNAAIKSLQAADEQVEQARANVSSQNAAVDRAKAELGSVSQSLAYNTITAPIDGIVGSLDFKKVGDYVSVGDSLTTITNNQNLELNINVPVEYRDRLRTGLTVESIDRDGSAGVEGKIVYVAPLVQQDTQSILAKVLFHNQESLKDREYLQVRTIWKKNPGILVPTTAISTLGGQNFVYVAKQKGNTEAKDSQSKSGESSSKSPQEKQSTLIAAQQPVKLGSIQDGNYQVVSGLQKGERIAVSNILSLQDGMPIKLAEEKVGSRE